jgi:small-conductance mechanosensitive channel
MLTAGVVLVVVVLALRAVSTNQHVRGRLLWSAVAIAVYMAAVLAGAHLTLTAALHRLLDLTEPLLLAFGVINAAVALVINPWRGDRLPDRFPTIVQDTIVIAMFALVAIVVLQDRIFATTAVGAVAIGFALQDTLGNLFAGLAIQSEKPFRVGHWVHVAGQDGLVREITWRATKIRTKAGNLVIVPNSVLSRDTITNYSEPVLDTRIELEVGAGYETPPNEVKTVILAAIKDEPLVSSSHAPEVLLVAFADSGITYRIRAWTSDFSADEILRDRIRSAVYYAFRRHRITIPYPIRVVINGDSQPVQTENAAHALSRVTIFDALSDADRASLAAAATRNLYAAGERVVRQGEAGSSMFVVVSGEAVVVLEPGGEVARIAPGGFFGEMSLLTGDPRRATVKTAADSTLMEITAATFREFVLANPAAVDKIGAAVAARTAELQRHTVDAPRTAPEPPQTLVARMRKFLHLT